MDREYLLKDNFDELQALFQQEQPFALFLGAGINAGFPNIMWKDLLNNLLSDSLNILGLEEGLSNKEISANSTW